MRRRPPPRTPRPTPGRTASGTVRAPRAAGRPRARGSSRPGCRRRRCRRRRAAPPGAARPRPRRASASSTARRRPAAPPARPTQRGRARRRSTRRASASPSVTATNDMPISSTSAYGKPSAMLTDSTPGRDSASVASATSSRIGESLVPCRRMLTMSGGVSTAATGRISPRTTRQREVGRSAAPAGGRRGAGWSGTGSRTVGSLDHPRRHVGVHVERDADGHVGRPRGGAPAR